MLSRRHSAFYFFSFSVRLLFSYSRTRIWEHLAECKNVSALQVCLCVEMLRGNTILRYNVIVLVQLCTQNGAVTAKKNCVELFIRILWGE